MQRRMNHRGVLMVPLVILGMPVAMALATEHHVPNDYETIQAAIDSAQDGDTILVAGGIYTGSGDPFIDLSGKRITLSAAVPNGTYIIGTEDQRGLVCNSGEDSFTRIEGFTFMSFSGGAFDLNDDGTIEDGETAGGAAFIENSSPVFSSCNFWASSAGAGGGAFVRNGSPTFYACSFRENNAQLGGGLYCDMGTVSVFGCSFNENVATTSGGGIYHTNGELKRLEMSTFAQNTAGLSGGGAYFENISTTFPYLFKNLTFQNNITLDTADDESGGGAGLFIGPECELLVSNCVLTENSAHRGGGLIIKDSEVELRELSIDANSSIGGNGAGAFVLNSTANVVNCTFTSNEASTNSASGGGMYAYSSGITLLMCDFQQNTSDAYGGGIGISNSSIDASRTTFSDNRSTWSGGAIATIPSAEPLGESSNMWLLDVDITRNTASSSGGGVALLESGGCILERCRLSENMCPKGDGGSLSISANSSAVSFESTFWNNDTGRQGGAIYNRGLIISTDSIFCSNTPSHVHGAWNGSTGNCFSFVCHDWTDDSVPDGCACAADFDGNGIIDGADLSALLSAWGTHVPDGDLTEDGVVDGSDLALLLAMWGGCFD